MATQWKLLAWLWLKQVATLPDATKPAASNLWDSSPKRGSSNASSSYPCYSGVPSSFTKAKYGKISLNSMNSPWGQNYQRNPHWLDRVARFSAGWRIGGRCKKSNMSIKNANFRFAYIRPSQYYIFSTICQRNVLEIEKKTHQISSTFNQLKPIKSQESYFVNIDDFQGTI